MLRRNKYNLRYHIQHLVSLYDNSGVVAYDKLKRLSNEILEEPDEEYTGIINSVMRELSKYNVVVYNDRSVYISKVPDAFIEAGEYVRSPVFSFDYSMRKYVKEYERQVTDTLGGFSENNEIIIELDAWKIRTIPVYELILYMQMRGILDSKSPPGLVMYIRDQKELERKQNKIKLIQAG